MAHTSHGHQIPGTVAHKMYPLSVARCGGVTLCKVCMEEAEQYRNDGTDMLPVDLQERAKGLLTEYIENYYKEMQPQPEFEVYIVWFAKVLQNWKAMMATDLPDGKYYELTYNGERQETYIDEYVKANNTVVPDKGNKSKNKEARRPWPNLL